MCISCLGVQGRLESTGACRLDCESNMLTFGAEPAPREGAEESGESFAGANVPWQLTDIVSSVITRPSAESP